MKKTSYYWSSLAALLVMTLSFVFVACGDDDDKKDGSNSLINNLTDDDDDGGGGSDKLYAPPYTQWGASKAMVKNAMSAYELSEEDTETIVYKGKYKESLTLYTFENSKLVYSVVAIETAVVSKDELRTFITQQGYQFVDTANNGDELFLSNDNATILSISKSTQYDVYYIYYFDYNWLMKEDDNTIYEEPYIKWGATKSQVKSNRSSNGYVLDEEGDTYIYYDPRFQEAYSGYFFENGKLYESDICVEESVASKSTLQNLIVGAGYSYLGTSDNGYIYYISGDQKTAVVLIKSSDYDVHYVCYVDYEWMTDDDNNNSNILYEDPYTVWGASRTTVKSAMSSRGYTLQDESNSASDYYYLAYNGKYQENFSMYFFDSSKKLDQLGIGIQLPLNTVLNYINSIAQYVGVNEEAYYFLTNDNKSVICAKQADNNYIYVYYWEYSNSSRATSIDGMLNTNLESNNEMMNQTLAQMNSKRMSKLPKNIKNIFTQIDKRDATQQPFAKPQFSKETIREMLRK